MTGVDGIAQNIFGDTRSGSLAGPLGLLIIVLLGDRHGAAHPQHEQAASSGCPSGSRPQDEPDSEPQSPGKLTVAAPFRRLAMCSRPLSLDRLMF